MRKNSNYDIFAAQCPSRELFNQVFSRWGILIIARLDNKTMRFRELAKAVDGISERMLSKTLKVLEQQGLVNRREFEGNSPRVEYSLTESGKRISMSVQRLIEQLYTTLEERNRTAV